MGVQCPNLSSKKPQRGRWWANLPPTLLLGLGEKPGQAPGVGSRYLRVPLAAPEVPGDRPSPGGDRAELSTSLQHQQGLILPQPSPASSPWRLSPRGGPLVLASPRHPAEEKRVRWHGEGGGRRGHGAVPLTLWPFSPGSPGSPSKPLSPCRGRTSVRLSPRHPTAASGPGGPVFPPHPRPCSQQPPGSTATTPTHDTLGPVSPGRPLAPSAPARPCETSRGGGWEGARGSEPLGTGMGKGHLGV